MKPIFVDTSALIALGNASDRFHDHATRLFKAYVIEKQPFITTNAVIFEMMNAFSAARYKPFALRLFDLISTTPTWKLVIIDAPLMKKGVQRFRLMRDKDWSLVDCISMIVAEEAKIFDIFTNDHHFEQAGLNILLTDVT